MAGNHGLEKGTEFSGTGVTASYKTLYGTWKLSLASLERQPLFLSTSAPLSRQGGSYLADTLALSEVVNLSSFSYILGQTHNLCV